MKYKIIFIAIIIFLSNNLLYAEECIIKYGVYSNYYPYEVISNNIPKGINIELIKAISKNAGCKLILETYDWNTLKYKLANDQLTLISSSMDYQTLEYATPLPTIFIQYRIILGKKGSKFIKDIKELENKKIAIFADSIPYAYLNSRNIKVEYLLIDEYSKALEYVLNGKVDYAFIDYYPFEKLETYSEVQIKSEPMFATPYGFIIGKNNPLYSKINETIMEMQSSGEYYKIIKKSKNNAYYTIKKAAIIIILIALVIILIVALWNKMLYETVKIKTKENKKYANLLQGILNHIPEYIFVIDKNFKIIWQNSEKENTFNINIVQKNLPVLLEQINIFYELNITNNNQETYHILLLKFTYEENDNYLLIASNITENIKLRDELFMTTRYSALGEMSTIIAHEINTPLASIMHNIGYLEDYICETNDEEINEDIKNAKLSINNSISKIQNIIGELKRYTNNYSQEYTLVNLQECCKNAIGITRFLINKSTENFSFNYNIDEELLIYGNQSQIEQMIINILQNACYFLKNYEGSINLSVNDSDEFINIIVEDNGCGMTEEELNQVFNPYYTTRKASGGTGLGLSLCNRLMKEHNGKILIESIEHKGTKVTLLFPKR